MFLDNVFFWAFISLFGLLGATSVVGNKRLGKYTLFGLMVVVIFFSGRFILALPNIDQPRFDLNGLNHIIGIPIFIVGCILALYPCFLIRPLNVAKKEMNLVSNNIYKYTRNPIYLGELLWTLGWSIIHGSIIGIALLPIWWAALLFHIFIEEDSLENALGDRYTAYKNAVKGRILPHLPF